MCLDLSIVEMYQTTRSKIVYQWCMCVWFCLEREMHFAKKHTSALSIPGLFMWVIKTIIMMNTAATVASGLGSLPHMHRAGKCHFPFAEDKKHREVMYHGHNHTAPKGRAKGFRPRSGSVQHSPSPPSPYCLMLGAAGDIKMPRSLIKQNRQNSRLASSGRT